VSATLELPPGAELRARLQAARLMLLFTPELCRGSDPLQVLEAALPHVDVVQVRVKGASGPRAPSAARELYDWTLRVLEVIRAQRVHDVLVIVDDRVDVAAALEARGVAGVHLGQEDCPVELARRSLGERALLGGSTHDAAQVAAAGELPLDYLGFGPIHATRTKGYERGLGCEAAWIASRASSRPVFPIGGIDLDNVAELAPIGRAAVASAILAAEDPEHTAAALRALLSGG
jgi:thiamine-phosphate diphosphorylase